MAPFVQQKRQVLHFLELAYQRRIALAHFRIAFDYFIDVGVRHALR